MEQKQTKDTIYDTTIRLFLLFLIVVWCLLIMLPFVHIILWGLILGVALMPIHRSLTKQLSGSFKIASFLIVFTGLAIIIIPSLLLLGSAIDEIKMLKSAYESGSLTIPPPPEEVKTWPIIGEKLYTAWSADSFNLRELAIRYKEQLGEIGKSITKGVLGASSGVFQLIGALIIAGILWVVEGTGEAIRKFFRKAVGQKGDEFADVVKLTIGNVVKGVLGVALIQSFLIGIGFLLADIPYAGLWTLLVLVFAVLQLPPAIVIIPVVAYIFSEMEMLPAILWTAYLFIAGLSDNILKPILLGKGAPVPMIVIFIGVIGGFIFSGFIGLFTGAIVMSVGYKLFVTWINSNEPNDAASVN